jgi:hypothetical protein
MKTKPLSRFILPVVLFSLTHMAFAQLDSMYTQQWNRDPVTDLKYMASAQRQIITAEQIRVSGYTQLSDVLQLVDGWTYSKDPRSHNWIGESNGIENYDYQNWVLMLNGQRINMDRILGLNVNFLAVSVNNIERIEVINTNGMYLGEFTQNGLINIITKKNTTNGFLANAFAATNKDISTAAVTLGYTWNRFHLNLSSNALYSNTGSPVPYKQDYRQRLEMQYTGRNISHQAQVISSDQYTSLGYLGLWNLNAKHQIRLSSSLTSTRYYYPYVLTNADQFNNTLQYRFLKNTKKGNFIWQTGMGFDYIKVLPIYSNQSTIEAPILKPYTSVNIPVTRKTNLFADGQVALCNNKAAPKISIGLYKRVSLISNYSFVLGYTETLPEEGFNTNIGDQINAASGAVGFYNPTFSTADFYYNLNIGNSVKFSFNSGLKNATDLAGYTYFLIPPPGPLSTISFYRLYDVVPSTHQLSWINRINIHYDIVKNLVFDINYLHTHIVNTWNENIYTIPKHKVTLTLQYDLPKRFTVWTRHYLQSQTAYWNIGNYSPESLSDVYYTAPLFYSFDLGLSKKLWKDYLNLNITARNILSKNREDHMYYSSVHNYQSSLNLSVTANIDGLFAKGNPKP